jgi:hypothetical protein
LHGICAIEGGSSLLEDVDGGGNAEMKKAVAELRGVSDGFRDVCGGKRDLRGSKGIKASDVLCLEGGQEVD